MKIFVYKFLISLFFLYIFFELTIGSRIDKLSDSLNIFNDQQSRIELKNKLRDELKKANEKDNYFTEEDRLIIIKFINKLREELNLVSN
tara:strand:+ start:142 stop:408 length:267 start_codon:yes stop_codon:yes gene_type:complete